MGKIENNIQEILPRFNTIEDQHERVYAKGRNVRMLRCKNTWS
jgi:hypothetical protein